MNFQDRYKDYSEFHGFMTNGVNEFFQKLKEDKAQKIDSIAYITDYYFEEENILFEWEATWMNYGHASGTAIAHASEFFEFMETMWELDEFDRKLENNTENNND